MSRSLALSSFLIAAVLPLTLAPRARADTGDKGTEELAKAAKNADKAVLIVGAPKKGHGTAFVISREHRLLATNAHVADIFHDAKRMSAIINGTNQTYEVKRIWYHPEVLRYKGGDFKNVVKSTNPADGPICPRCPDLAVLELTADGPALPAQLELAAAKDLVAKPLGILGFPGHDTSWPASGDKVAATYHAGTVSRLTDFNFGTSVADAEKKIVQYSMPAWGGYSGSPVFLANGRVVAVHNMSRYADDPRNPKVTKSIAHGVRVDCLWELIRHHGLFGKVPIPVKDKAEAIEWLKKLDASVRKNDRGDVIEVDFRAMNSGDALCALLEPLESLESLTLSKVTDAGLARLQCLKRLQKLHLHSSYITDTGLIHLKGMADLDSLDLGMNPAITDAGLTHLRDLTKLKHLHLEDTGVTGSGLEHLKAKRSLRTLELGNFHPTRVSGFRLQHLKDFSHLEDLYLTGSSVNDDALKTLAGANIRSLHFKHGTKITDAGLPHLGKLPQLEKLYLRGTGVTDAGLAHLGKLPKLSALWLDGTAITDAGLAHISGLKQLRLLSLEQTRVTGAGFAHLKGLEITSLLLDSTVVKDAELIHLKGISKLHILDLHNCKHVTDVCVGHLKEITSLKEVVLSGTSVTPEGVAAMRKALPKTEVIHRP